MVKEILLTRGKVALVDDEDYDLLAGYSWYYHARGYAKRSFRVGKRTGDVFMHRQIANASLGQHVDHKNGDRLDNRKENLRICTNQQNCINRGPNKNNTSGYKGVKWARGKWHVKIGFGWKHFHLGVFTDLIEAARAYDKKARELFGEFAWLNFPDEIKQ